MAVETKYICDRCGTEMLDKMAIRMVGVVVLELNTMYLSKAQVKRETLWCRDCMIYMGLTVPKTQEEMKLEVPAVVTIEDIIRELVDEHLENFQP